MTVQGEGNLWGGGWGPGMPFYRGSVTEAPPTIESNNFVRIKGCCNEFLYFKLQRRNIGLDRQIVASRIRIVRLGVERPARGRSTEE